MYTHKNGIMLRKLEKEDLSLLLDLKNESWQNTHQVNIVNTEDQYKWFKKLSKNSKPNCPNNLVLLALIEDVTTASDLPVGIFKLSNIDWYNRKAETEWAILEEHREQGHGTKLAQAGVDYCRYILSLHRLKTEILANNERSAKCAIKAGFILEGTEKESVLKTGRYVDNNLYGIILD